MFSTCRNSVCHVHVLSLNKTIRSTFEFFFFLSFLISENIIQSCITFPITLITLATSLFFSQTIFHYMYMYIGLYGFNKKVNILFYASKNAFNRYIKVGFQNLFFRLSEYSYDEHVSTIAIN